MSWVLSVIGVLAVLASSVPLYSGITSPSEIGPLYYIVSAVLFLGGLALIGLADLGRQLRGVAEGSMARPLGRVAPAGDAFEPAPAPAASAAPMVPPAPRIPFPSKTTSRARAPMTAAAPAAEPRLDVAPSIDTSSDHFERPLPSFARQAPEPRIAPESRIAPEPEPEPEEAPLSPAEPRFSATREDKDDLSEGLLATAFSRLDVSMRPAPPMNEAVKQREMFEAAWPAERKTQSEPARQPVEEDRQSEEEEREPRMEEPPAAEQDAPYAVSILKSGVVDGMAYTLYSDGSIEAEMPQGTMRFASITELRAYLDKSSS
jgi:hypothetical protein